MTVRRHGPTTAENLNVPGDSRARLQRHTPLMGLLYVLTHDKYAVIFEQGHRRSSESFDVQTRSLGIDHHALVSVLEHDVPFVQVRADLLIDRRDSAYG